MITFIPEINELAGTVVTKTLAVFVAGFIGWNLRWLIVNPMRLLFSAEYRDRRKLTGKYYLYHPPIISGGSTRIRLSIIHIKMRVYKNVITQRDWKVSKDVCYKGDLAYSGQFIVAQMHSKIDRFRISPKFLMLHRPFRGAATGICGKVVGISNANEIYALPAILSKKSLAYDAVQDMFSKNLSDNIGEAMKAEVRQSIENSTEMRFEQAKQQFDSPFS